MKIGKKVKKITLNIPLELWREIIDIKPKNIKTSFHYLDLIKKGMKG